MYADTERAVKLYLTQAGFLTYGVLRQDSVWSTDKLGSRLAHSTSTRGFG